MFNVRWRKLVSPGQWMMEIKQPDRRKEEHTGEQYCQMFNNFDQLLKKSHVL